MAKNGILQVILIGSGKVARNLGYALKEAGHCIVQVYSPTLSHARELASELDSSIYTNKVSDLIRNANCYIIAIKDDAIAHVVKQLNVGNGLVVHTSGGTSVDVFKENTNIKYYGVFYPFQTFTNRTLPFEDIPIFIESPVKECLQHLKKLGETISKKVSALSSENRLKLHTSAVFACNFLNHMLVLGNKLIKEANLNFAILRPLVEQTIANAFLTDNPIAAQTGPASRNDTNIINKHMELLASNPDLQTIYQQLTESILKQQNE
ncbi:MAG: DUF2520 domain-containing protein [Prevotellaceae bacterium]|jgi:predicted short-subunit dehydrogenase-like oxidoreductase (DUF2520 family)|nr:DUF2520 domain-containing protein [Prevotellaceae bacterium]